MPLSPGTGKLLLRMPPGSGWAIIVKKNVHFPPISPRTLPASPTTKRDNFQGLPAETDTILHFFFVVVFATNSPRYGAPNELLELGRVTPGTYCTRQYDECYRKKCRLQSPNYPGMYPRNVTCYWTIRQKVVPTCKHAMVAISQENEHKALVKR